MRSTTVCVVQSGGHPAAMEIVGIDFHETEDDEGEDFVMTATLNP